MTPSTSGLHTIDIEECFQWKLKLYEVLRALKARELVWENVPYYLIGELKNLDTETGYLQIQELLRNNLLPEKYASLSAEFDTWSHHPKIETMTEENNIGGQQLLQNLSNPMESNRIETEETIAKGVKIFGGEAPRNTPV